MPQSFLYNFPDNNPYVDDFGENLLGVTGFFKRFPDMTEAQAEAFAQIFGAVERDGNPPCPVSTNSLKRRKLRFIRSNRSSISMVIPSRADVIALATQGRDILNSLSPDFQVACIELIGESWINTYERFAPAGKTIAPGTPTDPDPSLGIQLVWSGQMTNYESDAPGGTEILTGFKMNTDNEKAAPTEIQSIVGQCMGATTENGICPTARNRKKRYFEATIAIPDPAGPTPGVTNSQTIQIPDIHFTGTETAACATAIAALPSVACLGYQGETNKALHTLL